MKRFTSTATAPTGVANAGATPPLLAGSLLALVVTACRRLAERTVVEALTTA